MSVDIYIDVIFAVNFIMDMFIFWVAGKLARMKTTKLRLTLGSLFAAASYCVMALLPVFRTYFNFFTMLAALMLALLICYNPKSIGKMLLLTLYANISAFAVGGAAFALFYYTNFGSMISGNSMTVSTSNLPLKILIAASALSYVTIKLFISKYGKIVVKKQVFYTIKILIDENEIITTALLDTGNSLLDPLTSEPVIIAEFESVRKLLPADVGELYALNKEDELLELMNAFSKSVFIKRVRIIPYNSLGKQNGMLIGFKPDCVQIVNTQAQDITTNEAIVGIYNYSLSQDGSFQALLNPSIL